jgi:hypothetical protein
MDDIRRDVGKRVINRIAQCCEAVDKSRDSSEQALQGSSVTKTVISSVHTAGLSDVRGAL